MSDSTETNPYRFFDLHFERVRTEPITYRTDISRHDLRAPGDRQSHKLWSVRDFFAAINRHLGPHKERIQQELANKDHCDLFLCRMTDEAAREFGWMGEHGR